MSSFFDLAQIVLIDLSLSGDNAIVVGMAVASLPDAQRKRATVIGIGAASLLRVVMALFAVRLLHVTGLLLAGGFLLAWVTWKMARELRHSDQASSNDKPSAKRLSSAIWQIIIADISMSLENVLAVAGVARTDKIALVIGLGLSVLLMALASGFIARLAARHPKVAYVGIAIVAYTALRMIYDGGMEIWRPVASHAFV